MTETSGTRHPNTGDLYPRHHPAHVFTTEEVEDILRFADEHGIDGVNEAKLIAFVRDVKLAHLRRAKAKGVLPPWPKAPQSSNEASP